MTRLTERELDLIAMSRHAGVTPATGLAGLARFVAEHIVQPVRQAILRRRTLGELRRLNDHLLCDIGLTRDDLAPVAARLAETAISRRQPGPGLIIRVRKWLKQRAAIRELKALDDRMLADIGLARGEIRAAVEAAEEAAPTAHEPGLVAGFVTRFRLWSRRRAAIREIEALDDRMLADIGVIRHDIPAAVEGLAAREAGGGTRPTLEQSNYWNSVVRALGQWELSRQAASQMARLHADTPSDLGYVKGDVDWVPEVLARRRLNQHKAA